MRGRTDLGRIAQILVNVDVSGQLPNLDVLSRLKVERADIRVPNPPPGKPPTLPVSVKGAPPAPPPCR